MTRFVISILFIASAVGTYFGVISPKISEIRDLISERNVIESTISRVNSLRKSRDNLLSVYNSIPQSELDRLNIIMPSRQESGAIIVQFERMAQNHNLILKNIDVSSEQQDRNQTGKISKSAIDPKDLKEITISLQVSGSYSDFRSFLEDAEQSLRLIDISQLSFFSGGSELYEFSLNAKAYWFQTQ